MKKKERNKKERKGEKRRKIRKGKEWKHKGKKGKEKKRERKRTDGRMDLEEDGYSTCMSFLQHEILKVTNRNK